MKNLKRTLAVFVSAIMVIAMLAGCGSSSIGSRLREVTKAGVSTSANKVASTLADGKTVDSDTVKAAVESVAGDESNTVTIYQGDPLTGVFKARIADEKNSTVGVYYAFEAVATYDEAVVVVANTVFEAIKADLAERYEGIEYYISVSTIDAEAGEYVIVVYADFAEATSVSTAA